MSTEISQLSGWLASIITGSEAVSANAHWSSTKPAFGYSTVFLLAAFAGTMLSAMLGGTFRRETAAKVRREHFGPSPGKRMVGAFVGGVFILCGARLAGGCNSGHGISGTLQLARSGWPLCAVMFISGIAKAKLMSRSQFKSD